MKPHEANLMYMLLIWVYVVGSKYFITICDPLQNFTEFKSICAHEKSDRSTSEFIIRNKNTKGSLLKRKKTIKRLKIERNNLGNE